MPTLTLSNITIKKLIDKNLNDYYLIIDNNQENTACFCFPKTVKTGWLDLVQNWENIREVELEFEEKDDGFKVYKKVVSL